MTHLLSSYFELQGSFKGQKGFCLLWPFCPQPALLLSCCLLQFRAISFTKINFISTSCVCFWRPTTPSATLYRPALLLFFHVQICGNLFSSLSTRFGTDKYRYNSNCKLWLS